MPIPERELFIALRELHAWLKAGAGSAPEPLALKDALQALFNKAERAAMEPLLPAVAALVQAGQHHAASKLLREHVGCSLGDARKYVTAYANAIAGSLVPQDKLKLCHGWPNQGVCRNPAGLFPNALCSDCQEKADA